MVSLTFIKIHRVFQKVFCKQTDMVWTNSLLGLGVCVGDNSQLLPHQIVFNICETVGSYGHLFFHSRLWWNLVLGSLQKLSCYRRDINLTKTYILYLKRKYCHFTFASKQQNADNRGLSGTLSCFNPFSLHYELHYILLYYIIGVCFGKWLS